MNKQIDISLGLANSHRMQFERHQIICPIVSIFIAPRDILLPKNRDYIYIAFDYIPSRDEREIVKISEQHYTSHFPELISLN